MGHGLLSLLALLSCLAGDSLSDKLPLDSSGPGEHQISSVLVQRTNAAGVLEFLLERDVSGGNESLRLQTYSNGQNLVTRWKNGVAEELSTSKTNGQKIEATYYRKYVGAPVRPAGKTPDKLIAAYSQHPSSETFLEVETIESGPSGADHKLFTRPAAKQPLKLEKAFHTGLEIMN